MDGIASQKWLADPHSLPPSVVSAVGVTGMFDIAASGETARAIAGFLGLGAAAARLLRRRRVPLALEPPAEPPAEHSDPPHVPWELSAGGSEQPDVQWELVVIFGAGVCLGAVIAKIAVAQSSDETRRFSTAGARRGSCRSRLPARRSHLSLPSLRCQARGVGECGAHARTSGSVGPAGSSSAYLPFASPVPSSGYSPLKQASQWVARVAPTAS